MSMTVSMSAVWDRTSEFLSDNLATVAGIAALTIFVPTAISESLAPLKESGGGVKLGLSALALAFALLQMWGQLTITALAIDPASTPGAARARASQRLPAMVAVALLLLLGALILALPLLGILIANGVDLTRIGEPGAQVDMGLGASGFVALYSLVMVPIGLWLLARLFVLVMPVVLAENLAVDAIARTWQLTRGLTWKIIGLVLLYGILTFVATMAAVTVFGAIFGLFLPGEGPITLGTVLTAIVGALVTTIFSVIGTAFPAKLYLAIQAREGAPTV